jgi:hypothetical protein
MIFIIFIIKQTAVIKPSLHRYIPYSVIDRDFFTYQESPRKEPIENIRT